MNNNEPMVSVLIPSHGRPYYFSLALASAVKQTYKRIEIIVSDDSYDNEIEKIVNDFQRKYDNIKYFHVPGLCMEDNWQKCWDNMSEDTDYVNFLMDDDVFVPTKIEKMVDVFEKYPSVAIVTSYRKLIDAKGNILPDRDFNAPVFDSDSVVSAKEAGRSIILNCSNWIGEPTTALIKKKYTNGFFRGWTGKEKYLIFDYPLWLRLLEYGDVAYISEPLSFFREHETNDSMNPISLVKGCISFALMIQNAWNNRVFISSLKELKKSMVSWFSLASRVMNICCDMEVDGNEYNDLMIVFRQMSILYTGDEFETIEFNI